MNKLLIIIILCVFVWNINFVQARTLNGVPIGGPLLSWFPCTCSGNFVFFIFDYLTNVPVPVVYQPLVSLYDTPQNAEGLFIPKTYQLGVYIPGTGHCEVVDGKGCDVIPTRGMYTPLLPGFGNSLLPSPSL